MRSETATQHAHLWRSLGWGGFYGFVLAAWAGIFLMSASLPGGMLANLSQPGFWSAICTAAAEADPLALFAMWVLMSAAMMAPTLVPALATWDDMTATGAATGAGFFALIAGYMAVWLGFSAIAAGAQAWLSARGLVAGDGASLSWWLTAALLITAGAYQFSRLKHACLSKCRRPLMFFMQYWKPGLPAAAGMGLRLGVVCMACCWALMALGFIGGTMNLVWMGLATAFMVLEKLPDIGRWLTRPAGVVLLAGGAYAVARATGTV
jgi:predicted metal-binding membrane protein